MAIRTDQFTNSLTVVDTVNANASLSLVPQGTGSVSIPGTGQNLVTYSSTLASAWYDNQTTFTTGQADPFGGTGAILLNNGTANNYHYLAITVTLSVQTYTFSAYVKAGTANYVGVTLYTTTFFGAGFNLTTGAFTSNATSAPTSYSITNAGNGWWRISITTTAVSGTNFPCILVSEDGVNWGYTATSKNILVAAPQLEIGTSANTYIPTTTSAIYGTPSLSFSGVSGLGLQSDGSLYASSAGAGNIRLYTNNVAQEQARISHTASAVNYLNITGGATGSGPAISALGSDANINLSLSTKANGSIFLNAGGTNRVQVDPFGGVNLAVSFSGGVGFKALATGNQVNFLQAAGATTGSSPVLSAQGSDTNIDINYTTKGTGSHVFNTGSGKQLQIADSAISSGQYTLISRDNANNVQLIGTAGNAANLGLYAYAGGSVRIYTNPGLIDQQLVVSPTASAVNYVQITGATTTNGPTITAQGSDSNIGIVIRSKGTFNFGVQNGAGLTSFVVNMTAGSIVNYLEATASTTGNAVRLSAQGSDTNIPLVLQPKGTGALQAQQTDSTATGGNARGANAVDFQTSRTAAGQVASGQYAALGGGAGNVSSSAYTVVAGGAGNSASGFGSSVVGGNGNVCSATYAFLGAGQSNTVSGYLSAVCTGISNTAAGVYNFIGGGFTNSATSNSAVTTQSGTMNGTTAVTLSGSNASIKVGQYIAGTSIAAETYVAAISGTSLTLSKVASGSSTSTLSFFTPHGVVVGGGNNQATGSYSFIGGGGNAGTAANRNVASGDWSAVVGGSRNVASGLGAFIGGNGGDGAGFYQNTVSGTSSAIVCGTNNTVSGLASFIGTGVSSGATGSYAFIGAGAQNTVNSSFGGILSGFNGNTRGIVGNHVFPACANPIANATGVSQAALLILGKQTTDATPTVLVCETSAPTTNNQVIMPNNSAYFFTGEIVSGVTGGGDTKGWTIEGVIKRGANAASTALVGTPTVTSTYADAGASTWVIAVTADTTNGGLAVTFTGQASTTIRTVAQIRTTEMTY